MKKILSVFLALMIVMSAFAGLSVSAASVYKDFDLYENVYHNYTYTDEHNYHQFTLTGPGVVTVYPGTYTKVNKSTNVQTEETHYIYLYSYDGAQLTQIAYKSVPTTNAENYFFFLDAGTYVVDFSIGYYSTSYKDHKLTDYGMTFMASKFDGHTRTATTTPYYSYLRDGQGLSCYNQITAKENTRIEITFNMPARMDGYRYSADLIVEKKTSSGWKEYSKEFYYTGDIPVDKSAVATLNVAKGTYRYYFDVYYSSGNAIAKYSEVAYVLYKTKITPASLLAVAKPTITQKTTYSSYYSTTRKITVNYDKNYDGVELWVKTNKGKYVKKSTCKLTSSSQYATFTLTLDYPQKHKYFYKVRAYTLYGSSKKYSAYSDVLYSKNAGVKKPTVTLKNKSRKITVSYKKLSGVSGYEIYRSTKKGSGYSMIKRTTATKYTTGKLTKNTKYYFKVRAYKTINGQRIYGKYSTVKYITAK